MNQILDYSPNKGDKKSSGSDKIVNFFAVIMIIFAVVLIAGAGYNLYKRNSDSSNVVAKVEKAEITVEQREKEAVIKVKHTKVYDEYLSPDFDRKNMNDKASELIEVLATKGE